MSVSSSSFTVVEGSIFTIIQNEQKWSEGILQTVALTMPLVRLIPLASLRKLSSSGHYPSFYWIKFGREA